MNEPETCMTIDEWRHVLRTAATVWDLDDFVAHDASPTPTETWWAALQHFQTQDVCEAFSRLALTLKFRPKLAEVVDAAREAAGDRHARERKATQDNSLRLAPPSQRTVEGRLRAFDEAARQWRSEQKAELEQFAGRYQVDGADYRQRMARLDEPGPYARRARELLAGHVEPGVGVDAMLRDFAQASDPAASEGGDAASPGSA